MIRVTVWNEGVHEVESPEIAAVYPHGIHGQIKSFLDTQEDIEWLCKKIANLRIFDDENGVMNRSVVETEGEVMVVSQFTLHASTKKGNRPSYIHASKPDIAIPMYEAFCAEMGLQIGKEVQTGTFGADMKVELVNDGPVTIWIDSQNKE